MKYVSTEMGEERRNFRHGRKIITRMIEKLTVNPPISITAKS